MMSLMQRHGNKLVENFQPYLDNEHLLNPVSGSAEFWQFNTYFPQVVPLQSHLYAEALASMVQWFYELAAW